MIYNHSDAPNAEWTIDDDNENYITFFATKNIKAGEEILHDYGTLYWNSRDG